jgi:hypothetical protein
MRVPYRVVFLGICLLTLLAAALGDDGEPTGVLDRRLRSIAGNSANNCGTVTVHQSPKKANQCVRRAFAAKKAFYVSYHLPSRDSFSAVGLAENGSSNLYLVEFDTIRFTPSAIKDDRQLLDDGHSIVTPCPKPVKLRTPNSLGRGLTCLSPNGKD